MTQVIHGNEGNFSDLVLKQDGNKIILWTQNNKIFKNKVPFSISPIYLSLIF